MGGGLIDLLHSRYDRAVTQAGGVGAEIINV